MLWWQWLSRSAELSKASDRFMQVSWLELRSYLVNTLLRDTDAMSMRYSLEVRVPFLDSPLVEYVLALPARVKAFHCRLSGCGLTNVTGFPPWNQQANLAR